jgi:transposase
MTPLDPMKKLKRRARELAEERGFTLVHFGIDPSEDGSASHVQMVVEYDPEKEHRPKAHLVIVEAGEAMTEELERANKERLAEEVEAARRELSEDLDLQRRLRERGGFLD